MPTAQSAARASEKRDVVTILAIGFSQSGQLDEILDSFLAAFPESCDIDRIHIRTREPYPFPWTFDSFFNAMPDAVLEKPCEIEPLNFKHQHYDLIVLAYQPWFLSPSTPTTALMRDHGFLARLNKTPVITLIGSRNMWVQAQESIAKGVDGAGGYLAGCLPLVDHSSNLVSVITILHWMLSGRKTRKWGIFPTPGVSRSDIDACRESGEIARRHFEAGTMKDLQKALVTAGMVPRNEYLAFLERNAKRVFLRVAKRTDAAPPDSALRRVILKGFSLYLGFAIFVVSPIVYVIFHLLYRPFAARPSSG